VILKTAFGEIAGSLIYAQTASTTRYVKMRHMQHPKLRLPHFFPSLQWEFRYNSTHIISHSQHLSWLLRWWW